MKELTTKLHLELVTYEDGMVSAKDYVEQTIAVCAEYFLHGWKNVKDELPMIEERWYNTYTHTREGRT